MRLVLQDRQVRLVQREPRGRRGLPAHKEHRGLPAPLDLQVRRELQGRQARLVLPELLVLPALQVLRVRQVLLGRPELVLRVLRDRQALQGRQVLLVLLERASPTSGFRPQPGFPAPLRGVASTPWKQPPTR